MFVNVNRTQRYILICVPFAKNTANCIRVQIIFNLGYAFTGYKPKAATSNKIVCLSLWYRFKSVKNQQSLDGDVNK